MIMTGINDSCETV